MAHEDDCLLEKIGEDTERACDNCNEENEKEYNR
jgi:hypothetical protein